MSATGWPTKKILGFRQSKKAKITLETNVFGETFFQYFQHFSILMKVCRWNLISFEEKRKNNHAAVNEKRKTEKIWTLFYLTGCFMTLKMVINHFFFNRSFCSQDFFCISPARSKRNFCFVMSGWRKKYQKGKLGTTNS